MLKNKFLRLSLMSTLLLTTVFGAGTQNCVEGACFVKLDKLNPLKGFEKQKNILIFSDQLKLIEKKIDKTISIFLDGEAISVFPSYVMTEAEKINYFDNKKANEDLLKLTQSVEKIEDKILGKSILPISDYYCEKETKALYNKVLGSFECV